MPGWLIAAVIGGAVGTALVDYGYGFRLSALEYRAAALVQGGTAIGRVSITLLAAVLLGGEPAAVFLAYAGVSFVSGLAQGAVLWRNAPGRPERLLVSRLVRYSLWVGVANFVVVLSLYQGTFLLLRSGPPGAAGVFGLALTLSLAFFALYNGFHDYIFPRIVQVASVPELCRFLTRSCVVALALSLACLPIVGVAAVVIPHLVRREFAGVATVFLLLTGSMLVLLLQAPFEAACQALLRPSFVLLTWLLRVVAAGIPAWLWATEGGAVATAQAQLGGSALAMTAVAVLVMRELRATRGPVWRRDASCAG
jgi:hypothetical protein